MKNCYAYCTVNLSSQGATHPDKICRLEVEDYFGRGKDRQRDSGFTKTSINVDGASASPNGSPDWLARGGMKSMTSIIA